MVQSLAERTHKDRHLATARDVHHQIITLYEAFPSYDIRLPSPINGCTCMHPRAHTMDGNLGIRTSVLGDE